MNNSLTLLGLISRQPSYGYDLKHSYDRYFGTGKPLAMAAADARPVLAAVGLPRQA